MNKPCAPDDHAPRRYTIGGHSFNADQVAPGLHIVATPIGNLGDITLRALATLAGADLMACEDTRVTRKLLDRYDIATPLTPYHDHNAATARPKLLQRLAAGEAIALVSDAGAPVICRFLIQIGPRRPGSRVCGNGASGSLGAARGVGQRRFARPISSSSAASCSRNKRRAARASLNWPASRRPYCCSEPDRASQQLSLTLRKRWGRAR